MKNLTILGSTGSIGRQALEVVRANPGLFNIRGLSAHTNLSLLSEQAQHFKPDFVTFCGETDYDISSYFSSNVKIFHGREGLIEMSSEQQTDMVLNAIVGSAGLESTLAVLKSGKILALANKESMVAGGELINKLLEEKGGLIIPVDSEHNALFQCLAGENKDSVKKLYLTGSGGPFRGKQKSEFENASPEEALKHPRWSMGKKISIDSATMMNKGLEVIEAHYLFKIAYENIEVVIHPRSIIHSMVLFRDNSVKAQLGPTDMRLPIQYALTYPDRIEPQVPELGLYGEILEFEKPDYVNFPCLAIAYASGRAGRSIPGVMNAANEEAVKAFLDGKIKFGRISEIIETVISRHNAFEIRELSDAIAADSEGRELAKGYIDKVSQP